MAKEKITDVFGGGTSLSSGPSSLSGGPNPSEGHLKAYGGSETISSLRDGSRTPNGSDIAYPSSYKTDGAFVTRHIQRKVKGSGDETGAGSAASDGSLGA